MNAALVLTTKTVNCNSHPTFSFYNRDKAIYVPFHCGSWNCPSCAPIKAENVTADLIRSAYENDLTKHLTLTLDPKKIDLDQHEYMKKVWAKMRVYLWRLSKRRHRRLKWQKMLQIQPGTGNDHYHIMLSQYIPFKWLKESWQALGGGSVYIRAVKVDSVSSFVRGYFTKQVLNQRFPYRARRYSCSRNIHLARAKQAGWELHRWVEAPYHSPTKGDQLGYHAMVDRTDFLDVKPIIIQGAEK